MTENEKADGAEEFDPRTDSRYTDFLESELVWKAAREDAERITAQSLWTPPPFPTSRGTG